MAADALFWMLPSARLAAWLQTLNWLFLTGNPTTVLLINVPRSKTRRLALST
jgi:hypothetical protein